MHQVIDGFICANGRTDGRKDGRTDGRTNRPSYKRCEDSSKKVEEEERKWREGKIGKKGGIKGKIHYAEMWLCRFSNLLRIFFVGFSHSSTRDSNIEVRKKKKEKKNRSYKEKKKTFLSIYSFAAP